MSKKLTLKIAQNFLNDPDGVNLEDYTSMDDAAAQALGKHEGFLGLGGLFLGLGGLTSLSDAAAQALAQHEGDLYLDGKAEEAVELARKRLAKQK